MRQLKEQVETADRSIREAAARGTDELKAMVEEARQSAETHAAGLHSLKVQPLPNSATLPTMMLR